jgi:hypothetical protein
MFPNSGSFLQNRRNRGSINLRTLLSSGILTFLVITSSVHGQITTNDACYEIRHLDFFGLENIEFPKWSYSEIGKINSRVRKDQEKDSTHVLEFTIPLLVYQLQEFHPKCVKDADTSYLSAVIDMYWLIRQIDSVVFSGSSMTDKIDFIRDDFYELVKEDQNLIDMSFTFDDGPFHGIDCDSSEIATDILETKFGSIEISELNGVGVLTARSQDHGVIWRKQITGLQGSKLGEISLQTYPMRETSLATIFHFYASGERLTLYVKNDGRFMYYFHSW